MNLKKEPTAAELGIMKGFPPPEGKLVNSANWNSYPLNRWSFQNVRRILPTAQLYRDPDQMVPFPQDPQNLDHLQVDLGNNTRKTVPEILESWQTDSIVVLHNGKLVYERYWNGMSPTKPHAVFSVSKSYIGTLGAILVDRGVLDRDLAVEIYVPDLTDSGFAGASIGQLLDMTAGTAWDESPVAMADENSPARQYFAAAGVLVIPGSSSGGVASFLPSIESNRPHGQSFVYNAPQTDVMNWVVARVTKRSLMENLNEEIWSKLGTEGDAYYLLDGAGAPWATGGMSICARDMARFGQMMLNGGHFGGRRVVSDSVITKILTKGDKATYANGPHTETYPNGAYRDYWWITNNRDGVYLAKGVFGQLIYINPKAQVVITRHASEKETSNKQKTIEVEAAFQAIADFLSK